MTSFIDIFFNAPATAIQTQRKLAEAMLVTAEEGTARVLRILREAAKVEAPATPAGK